MMNGQKCWEFYSRLTTFHMNFTSFKLNLTPVVAGYLKRRVFEEEDIWRRGYQKKRISEEEDIWRAGYLKSRISEEENIWRRLNTFEAISEWTLGRDCSQIA